MSGVPLLKVNRGPDDDDLVLRYVRICLTGQMEGGVARFMHIVCP